MSLGALAAAHTHALEIDQRQAWEEELDILGAALAGTLYLEFDVPRLGSRIDAVLVSGPAVFPIEFKCGERQFRMADYHQAWDYALDLKNFHAASHDAPILPVLVATQAEAADEGWQAAHPDGVRPPYRCGARHLRSILQDGLAKSSGPPIDGEAWGAARYQPTPTIIEAARALYARHSVEAISRHDAGAKNLRLTSVGVEEIFDPTPRTATSPSICQVFVKSSADRPSDDDATRVPKRALTLGMILQWVPPCVRALDRSRDAGMRYGTIQSLGR